MSVESAPNAPSLSPYDEAINKMHGLVSLAEETRERATGLEDYARAYQLSEQALGVGGDIAKIISLTPAPNIEP